MIDWPSARPMRSEMMRPSASVGPPAGKGTTMVMGRSGQVSAAAARGTAATIIVASPRKMRHRAIIGHPNTFRGTHAYSGYKIADAALPATSVRTKKMNGARLWRRKPKLLSAGVAGGEKRGQFPRRGYVGGTTPLLVS